MAWGQMWRMSAPQRVYQLSQAYIRILLGNPKFQGIGLSLRKKRKEKKRLVHVFGNQVFIMWLEGLFSQWDNTASDRGTSLNSGDSQKGLGTELEYSKKASRTPHHFLTLSQQEPKTHGSLSLFLVECRISRIVLSILFCYCLKVHMHEHICTQYMLVIFISSVSYSLLQALFESLSGMFPIFISLHPISTAHKQVFRVIQWDMVTLPIPTKERRLFPNTHQLLLAPH